MPRAAKRWKFVFFTPFRPSVPWYFPVRQVHYFRAWARSQLEVNSPFFSRTYSAIGFPVLALNSSSLLGAFNASAAGWAAVKVAECWLDAPIENAKLFSTSLPPWAIQCLCMIRCFLQPPKNRIEVVDLPRLLHILFRGRRQGRQPLNSAPPAPHEYADKCVTSVPERLELYLSA